MADNTDRKMLLVAFLQASNCSNYTGSWRHPDTVPGFLDLEFYQGIAATLEQGKFHLAFIDDDILVEKTWLTALAELVTRWGTGPGLRGLLLGGDSAGGGLALSLAQALREQGKHVVILHLAKRVL